MNLEMIIVIIGNERRSWTDRKDAVEYYSEKAALSPERTDLRRRYESILERLNAGETLIQV